MLERPLPVDLYDTSDYTFPNRFRRLGARKLVDRYVMDVANVVHSHSDQVLEMIGEQDQAVDVARQRAGVGVQRPAALGLPGVTVNGLTLAPTKQGARLLYAATHGRGAYRLRLP